MSHVYVWNHLQKRQNNFSGFNPKSNSHSPPDENNLRALFRHRREQEKEVVLVIKFLIQVACSEFKNPTWGIKKDDTPREATSPSMFLYLSGHLIFWGYPLS